MQLLNNAAYNPTMSVSIIEEKKIIIHNVLKAIVLTGVILAVLTALRDYNTGIEISNSLVNIFFLLVLSGVIIFGKNISYSIKSAVLIAVTIFMGVKVMLVNGVIAGTFYFFIVAATISLLMLSQKRATILIVLISLIYFATSTLITFGFITPRIDVANIDVKIKWLLDLFTYSLVLFMLIGGVGRLHRTFLTSIQELDETNQKLNQSNEELTNQLEQIRAMQIKVEQTEFNFKRLFDESNDGIILCDKEGVIIESNISISRMLDYPKSFLIGNKASDFVIADDKRVIDQLAIEKVNRSKIKEIYILTRPGARVPVEINYSPIMLEDEKVLLVTVRDIRERKLTEQKVLNAVIQAEENERSRFATDLHDDLGPILSSIKMYIQSLRTHEDSEDKKELVNRLVYTVDDSIKSIRRISYNLSSHLLQNMGLVNALKTHADRINLSNTMKVQFQHNLSPEQRLSSNIEIVIYRVVLELINNSVKHSQGNLITIDLAYINEQLMIHYTDNGIGFDIDKMLYDNTKGIGLKNILSRIKSIQGMLHFETRNVGFSLSINVNL
jgi:PAS domain S-box-containing protein